MPADPDPRDVVRQFVADVQHLPAQRRDALLELVCAGDAELLREARALARAASDSGVEAEERARLDADATDPLPAERAAVESEGDRIGRYTLLEPIGEGGMGSVWLAEQTEPVARRVALKIIKLGMDTREVIARFAAERQALAVMDHPNIAKVLDAGATDGGRPYFVMEYIEGVPIVEYCDEHQLDTRARLELFAEVCAAIQHAHQKGLVHRDIKPSNVLVALQDGVPTPKVIDFGIAKATTGDGEEATLLTQVGQVIGTPAYMAPEQAERGGLDIDTRADIYSLGVLLYELLTGSTPFDIATLLQEGYAEMMRAIREVDPPRPSTRLSSLGDTATRTAQLRRTDAKALRTLLSGDLDWIVMRCLEKDRERRYESANALADDVRRHLADEPVLAGPPSARYRMAKFVKRNRAQVVAGALVLVVLLLGIVGTTVGLVWALDERDRADEAAETARLAEASEAEQRKEAEESEERALRQASIAERAEADAKAQALLAQQLGDEARARADELETVANFQSAQLMDVDVPGMGDHVRASLLASVPEAERDALDAALAPINFSNIALSTLEANLLDRTYLAIQTQLVGQPRVRARMLSSLAGAFNAFGIPARALAPLQQVIEIWREQGEEYEGELIDALVDLASLLVEVDQAADGEPLMREALEIAGRTLDEDDPRRLFVLGTWGVMLDRMGRSEEAEPLLRRAHDGFVRAGGDASRDALWMLTSLGGALTSLGRFDEAEALLDEALSIQREVFGDDDPATLQTLLDLAHVASRTGALDRASELYLAVRDGRRRALGDDHPTTLNATYNYAISMMWRDDHRGAQALLVDVLEAQRRVLGDLHWMTLETLEALGDTAMALEQWDDAIEYRREAYTSARESGGTVTSVYFYAAYDLLNVLEDHGSVEEALAVAEESSEAAIEVLSPGGEMTCILLGARGRCLLRLERIDEAREPLMQAYEGLLAELGPENERVADAAWTVAVLYARMDEVDPGQGYGELAEEWAERH